MTLASHLNFRISEEDEHRLLTYAKNQGVSSGEMTRILVVESLDRRDGKKDLQLKRGTVRSIVTSLLAIEEIVLRTFDQEKCVAIKGEKLRELEAVQERSRAQMEKVLKMEDY